MDTFDVAIVGGGLIGASVAFELAGRNLRVVVLDRQQPGREASWAAAGMLAPGPDSPNALPLVPLAKESLRLYPEFVAAIEHESGRTTEFVREGTLEIFFGPAGETERDAFVSQHKRLGLPAEPIPLEAARELELALGPSVVAVAWLPGEATVDPRLLTAAVLAAAEARGAQIRAHFSVSGPLRERDCCAGVVADREKILARHVVIAAGCFSGGLGDELARCAPTHPVRGQMMSLRHSQLRLRHVLRSANGYLVSRADGRILAGSTLENAAGFEKAVTAGGTRKIINAALELAPSLSSAEIVETWAGLRPGTPDGLPILGPTDLKGLIVATGHYRNGILLAPVTAKLVASWVCGERTTIGVEPLSPMRFERIASPAAERAGGGG